LSFPISISLQRSKSRNQKHKHNDARQSSVNQRKAMRRVETQLQTTMTNPSAITRIQGAIKSLRLPWYLKNWTRQPNKPYAFLALPAELRLQIYEACLAPTGTLYLASYATRDRAVQVDISPALLATCRQIYAEARDFLCEKNTFCIELEVRTLTHPDVLTSRLSHGVLRNIQSLCLILDCTGQWDRPERTISEFAFAGMTSLRVVRVTAVWCMDDTAMFWGKRMAIGDLLYMIRLYLPRHVQSELGVEPGSSEERMALDLVEELRRNIPQAKQLMFENVAAEELADTCADGMEHYHRTVQESS
jgi:hypothetical protein